MKPHTPACMCPDCAADREYEASRLPPTKPPKPPTAIAEAFTRAKKTSPKPRMTTQQAFARVGDVMVVRASSPAYINPLRVIRITLENDKQCAYANQLLSDPQSGWKLEQPTQLS